MTTTTTTIGTGTRKLGEWAVSHFWPPCEECDNTHTCQSCVHGTADYGYCHDCDDSRLCPACIDDQSDHFLSASTQVIDGIENRFSPDWWQVFGDHLEEQGDPRAADARLVARLLPLNVWPLVERSELHWYLGALHKNAPCNIQHLFPHWKYHANHEVTRTGFPTIIDALLALDTAIQERQ